MKVIYLITKFGKHSSRHAKPNTLPPNTTFQSPTFSPRNSCNNEPREKLFTRQFLHNPNSPNVLQKIALVLVLGLQLGDLLGVNIFQKLGEVSLRKMHITWTKLGKFAKTDRYEKWSKVGRNWVIERIYSARVMSTESCGIVIAKFGGKDESAWEARERRNRYANDEKSGAKRASRRTYFSRRGLHAVREVDLAASARKNPPPTLIFTQMPSLPATPCTILISRLRLRVFYWSLRRLRLAHTRA